MSMANYPLTEINTVLLPQFQDWTDKYGLMQDNPDGGTTGNGVLFTAHYVFGLISSKLITDGEKKRLLEVFASCVMAPGILMRDPINDGGYEAHDDLVGLMSAEAMLCPNKKDRKLTKAIYDYGKSVKVEETDETEPAADYRAKNKLYLTILKIVTLDHVHYVWNNRNPAHFHAASWLQRRMEVMATMQMQQNKWLVNPIYWLYWALSMMQLVMKPNKGYQDGYTLRFHSAIACEGFGPITNWICKKVRACVARDFGDFGQLLSAYFNKPQHPIVALCKDKY